MSKPWGGVGAWAAEAERAEAEEKEAAAASGIGSNAESQSFPSLKEAVKKPKNKKMSLSEFTTGSYSSSEGGIGGVRRAEYNRLTPEGMMILPTRPKERSAEEMQYGRLKSGFASYERSGPPQGRAMRDREESDGSWGTGRRQYGGFDEERRGPPPRPLEYDQPSRADEVDNWAMAKKSAPAFDSGRQNRYGGLGTGGGMSRADEVDNWLAGKKPIAARSSSYGSSFHGSAPEPDRWSRGGGGFREERPRLVLDPPSGEVNEQVVRTNKPNPFGAARPREEVLAEKGLDWKQVDSEIEAKKANERPTSSQSSRPSSAHSSRSETQQPSIENVVRTRPKVNPFGDGKPREVLLQERGQDWRKIDLDLEHRRVDRPEQDEERILKEDIDNLRKELEKESAGDQSSLRDRLLQKEKDLEMLMRDFDDKIRFGQRVERPGSGAGRIGGFPDRPPSQSGSSDGSRSVEFTNRPRSHGTGDAWTRPGNDKRAFQGGREREFLDRDLDRQRSRERW